DGRRAADLRGRAARSSPGGGIGERARPVGRRPRGGGGDLLRPPRPGTVGSAVRRPQLCLHRRDAAPSGQDDEAGGDRRAGGVSPLILQSIRGLTPPARLGSRNAICPGCLMAASSRRAVITGVGVLSPIGLDAASFWRSLGEGKSGVRPIRAFDASTL